MEPNIIIKTNKKFYEEENETCELLAKNSFSKNSNQIFKKNNFFIGKIYLDEPSIDDYTKIQIPVKKFSYQNMNKNTFILGRQY